MHRVIRIRKLKTTLEILFQCLNAKSVNNQLLKLKKVIEFRGKHLLCQLFELWWLIMNPFCIETLDSIYVLVNDACWFRDSFFDPSPQGGGDLSRTFPAIWSACFVWCHLNLMCLQCLLCLMSSASAPEGRTAPEYSWPPNVISAPLSPTHSSVSHLRDTPSP